MTSNRSPSTPSSPMSRRGLLGRGTALGLGALLGIEGAQAQDGAPSALERVRTLGRLSVGLYNELPPFHDRGQGIEIELARALAQSLGVKVSLLPFTADENMNDDLRNMVWKGHYLGYGPADVLLHVPVDRPLMQENPQVSIFGPYWRERVVVARDLSKVPVLDSLEPLKGQKIAVPGQSLAGWLMIGAESGMLRDTLTTKIDNGVIAAQMLQRGEVVAAAGLRSELETVLRGDSRYAIEPIPMPRAPKDGWAVGMATKKSATDLAQALQGAVNGLAESGALKAMFARANLDWHPV
ncbi:transporter substrate-binding domain-containing protein [Sphaerotilus uruguayifluvii]|uniref:ABC-type amino acid transport substrate-binding protein n=1 Tax=Sphaerotilus uruguayifluvii TaxID=2735897 RepID=A0ABX2G732_9BURK|nr:transporter substrate-binding domain-containing protein [Leptothrix sp. C29]NRT57219.1 ABC-type amino acid transport substrate-binding protein [Leptothrix sp. C29]